MTETYEESIYPSKLTTFTLGLSRYAPRGANLVAGVLLIEIGITFGLPVGVINQLNVTHSLLSLITALAMGVLSIKFGMEYLLLTGLGLSMFSAVGFCISPSFQMTFLLYSLNGIAWSLVYPMSIAFKVKSILRIGVLALFQRYLQFLPSSRFLGLHLLDT